jgi:hypothetical protein
MAASVTDILDMIRGAARRDKNPGLLRRSRDLAVSLYFLAQDWKPCLLFDFCAASDETLLAFRKAAAGFFCSIGNINHFGQCWVSVAFWCGSGSADPYGYF